MKDIRFRRFRNSDQEAVRQLHIKGLKQTGSLIDNREFDRDLKAIKKEYIDNGGEFLVVTHKNCVVGIGGLRRVNSETAEIKRMRVGPEYQGTGIGSLILDKLIEKAQVLGYKRLILDTTIKQQLAQQLYKSRGFKEYQRKNIGDLELVFYELYLSEAEGKG